MGITLVLLSSLFFSLSAVFGKIITLNSDVSGVVVTIGRFSMSALVMFIYMVMQKKSFKINNLSPIAIRGIFNALSIMTYYVSFQYTTITKANMLHMLYPGFIIILTPFVLKERVPLSKYIYLILMMIAAYMIVNPDIGIINIGDMLAILSAITASFSVMALTMARKRDDTHTVIFYVMLIALFVNLPFAYEGLLTMPKAVLPYFLLSAFTGMLGQVALTMGYKLVDSSTGALISSNRIVITTVIGVLFLSEPINMRILSAITITIFCLVGISGYFQNRRNNYHRHFIQ